MAISVAITVRHRVLATILQRVSAPLKRADLLAIAHYLISRLSYNQIPAVAKRHKVETKKDASSAQELLVKQVEGYEESELCRLLIDLRLLFLRRWRAIPTIPIAQRPVASLS